MNSRHLLATLVVAVVALTGVVCAQLVGAGPGGSPGPATTVVTATTVPTSRPDGQRAATPAPRPAPADQKLSQADLIAKVKPSVVHIRGTHGGGSGVVVNGPHGLVLTNAHVMFGQHRTRARVGDDPATETAVQLVAAAPCDDLAVVRLVNRSPNLRALRFGDSSKVRPGDHVTVLGYPKSFDEKRADDSTLAQQLVATDGNVSAVDVVAAPDPSLPRYASTIQHQAPTNPGNSGGPLVDDRGRLVGVNSLRNPETQGQFYSISSNQVRRVLPDLMAGTSQGDLGWDLISLAEVDLPAVFAQDPNYADQGGAALGQRIADRLAQEGIDGMYVQETEAGSPAEYANLRYGDLLTSIDNQKVRSMQDVCEAVLANRPGTMLKVSGYSLYTADAAEALQPWEVEVAVP